VHGVIHKSICFLVSCFALAQLHNAWAAEPGSLPASLNILLGTSNQVTLSWSSRAGALYNLQQSPDGAAGQWRNLAGIISGSGANNTVSDTANQTRRFYRIITIQNNIQVAEADAGTTVQLGLGDLLTVVLAANPSTGYVWDVVPETPACLAQIGDSSFTPGNGNAGSPGKMTFQFEPVSTGRMTLRLVYHRPWETGVAPLETFELTIVVKA
jgi:inhibitor of cysteine peptidase